MNAIDEIIAAAEAEATSGKRTDTCGCGAAALEDVTVVEKVVVEEDGTSIDVEVPAVRCGSCGVTYTDHRAEPVRQTAICRHFGLLAPEEIRTIRRDLGMSRPKFSEAFGIPTASLERWENGRLMQNESTDTLLRAIRKFGGAMDRKVLAPAPLSRTVRVEGNVVWAHFPSLAASEEKRIQAIRGREAFELRSYA